MSSRTLLSLFFLVALVGGALWFAFDDGVPSGKSRTIVLLTPDTLRADRVGCYAPAGASQRPPHTPNMDRLAASGLRFEDARTPAPLTLPAHTTMLTGLAPAETGVRLNTYGRLPPAGIRGYPLLQEQLRNGGWHTAAFLSAAVLGSRYGLDQGFDHYDDQMPVESGSRLTVKERAGEQTVAATLAYVRSRPSDERLFLWVHLFEPHAPYKRDGTYAGDVAHLDEIVGQLLDGLAAAGRGDAAILLASDHGEALGEFQESTHGLLLADGVLQVPFLLRAPGISAGVRVDPVELADISATLAGIAGVPWPGPGLDLLRAEAPADRIRLAESLYAHHRFRWAQLIAARGPDGTVVDVGRDRLYWLPPTPWQGRLRQRDLGLPDQTPTVRRQADAIAQYKGNEKPDRIVAGQAAAGYGGGGLVVPFLPSERNGDLPDPYASIGRAIRLDKLKARLATPRLGTPEHLRETLGMLRTLGSRELDAESPELHFWIGQAHKRLARALGGDPRQLALAERAYTRAYELGRKDTQTLVQACGVNAAADKPRALERLEALVKQLTNPGCQYWMLKSRLLTDLQRGAEAAAACRAAEALCNNPRDAHLWRATCR